MTKSPEDIFKFLPLKYASSSESDYVAFWWNAYLKNLEWGNYHLSFLAFHMLYMTGVYFLLYKISKIYRLTYEHSLFHLHNDDETHYRGINSPFSFVNMNEKGVFRFLKIAGADHNFIGEVSKFIEDRNNASHAKGLIYFDEDPYGLEKKVFDYVDALESIQNLFINEAKKVSETWKISKLNESDIYLFIESEIKIHNLTPAEINVIAKDEKLKRPKLYKVLNKLVGN